MQIKDEQVYNRFLLGLSICKLSGEDLSLFEILGSMKILQQQLPLNSNFNAVISSGANRG